MRGALVLWFLGACSPGNELPVRTWKLSAGGRDLGTVTFPADLNDRVRRGRYTLETEVDLPPGLRGGPLTLGIAYVGAVARVVTDGQPAVQLGEDTGRATAPPKGWRLIRREGSARLAIRIDVEPASFFSMHLPAVPVLSGDERGPPSFLFNRRLFVMNGVMAVAILVTLIFIYGSGWLLERRPQHGHFVIIGLSAITVLVAELGYLYPLVGPPFVALMAVCVAAAGLFQVYFIHATFQLGRVPRLFHLLVVPTLIAVAISRDPFDAGRLQMLLAMGATLPMLAYSLARLARVASRPRANQDRINASILLGGWLVIAVLVTFSTSWVAGRNLVLPSSPGMAIIGVALALALGRDRVLRLRDVQRLNEDLRRQIGDRAGQLAAALARLKPAAPLEPGAVIEDRYRIVSRLGAGGMGTVYRVERIADGRPLALKVLSGASDREALARFAREAQIAAQLDHPNVVSVLDVDVSRSGMLFLVMELVEGATLAEKKSQYGDVRWASLILKQIAEALAAMHARGIVHRDLKPSNVLLDGDRAKVADFGIASLAGDTPGGGDSTVSLLTRTGAFMGTPMYMAPELSRGARDATPAADIFSFGVVAYQLLGNRLPHATPPVLEKLEGRTPPLPAPLGEGVPAPLRELVGRCLATASEQRPTAAELAVTLSS